MDRLRDEVSLDQNPIEEYDDNVFNVSSDESKKTKAFLNGEKNGNPDGNSNCINITMVILVTVKTTTTKTI